MDVHQRGEFWCLRVRGKGGKTRHVELSEPTRIRIDRYLECAGHGDDPDQRRGPLFRPVKNPGQKGCVEKPLSPEGVYKRIIRKYGAELGLGPGVFTTHSCRATAATNALEHEAALEEVQAWLGHADVSTTRLYARRRGSGERSPPAS